MSTRPEEQVQILFPFKILDKWRTWVTGTQHWPCTAPLTNALMLALGNIGQSLLLQVLVGWVTGNHFTLDLDPFSVLMLTGKHIEQRVAPACFSVPATAARPSAA